MISIHRAILIINLALITLGAYFGVSLFYQVMAHQMLPPQETQVAATPPSRTNALTNLDFNHYRPILQRDLFKTQKSPMTALPKVNVNLDELAETQLKLKLWGTVTGDPEQAYAVIEDTQKREQNLYRIGDSIQNAVVKLIQRTKVVLSLEGKDEVLAMEDIGQSGTRSRALPHTASRASSGNRPSRSQRVSLRRNMIDNAIKDVSSLMTQIKIRPHMVEGQSSGLSLSSIKPNSIFRRMGLRNGDVLKSVDGQEIRTVDDALRLYESLKSTDKVSVQLERRGSDRTIDYNIR
jgi:general secretion pathway protein C